MTLSTRVLKVARDYDKRLQAEMQTLAARLGGVVMRFATGDDGDGHAVVPVSRTHREALRRALWDEVLRPYFVGRTDEAFSGPTPNAPYARLIADGVADAVYQVATAHHEIVKRATRKTPAAAAWLLDGNRPLAREMVATLREIGPEDVFEYDPFHLFVDPRGYRLSDRVWQTATETRRMIDRLLDYHVAQGTAAVDIAKELERFLNPLARAVTRKPYGTKGSYAARRLARTEITAAAGRATIAANLLNPFVAGTDWALSASHPEVDICDDLATIGMSGERVRDPYPSERVPAYPPHPHCLCTLMAAVADDADAIADALEARIRTSDTEAIAFLRGAFGVQWLSDTLTYRQLSLPLGAAQVAN